MSLEFELDIEKDKITIKDIVQKRRITLTVEEFDSLFSSITQEIESIKIAKIIDQGKESLLKHSIDIAKEFNKDITRRYQLLTEIFIRIQELSEEIDNEKQRGDE